MPAVSPISLINDLFHDEDRSTVVLTEAQIDPENEVAEDTQNVSVTNEDMTIMAPIGSTEGQELTIKDTTNITVSGKHDLNLALRGCFILSRKDQRKRIVRRWVIQDPERGRREVEFEAKSADPLPHVYDMEKLMALITLACQDGRTDGVDVRHPYKLLRLLGKTDSGKDYQDLANAIDRLSAVTIRGTFREQTESGGKWNTRTKWDHLIQVADLEVVEDTNTGGVTGKGLRVIFGETLQTDLASHNIWTFDWSSYKEITGGDGVKALFIYVGATKKRSWEVNLLELAELHLGMEHYQYPSQVWKKVEPILRKAKDQGIIEGYGKRKQGQLVLVAIRKWLEQGSRGKPALRPTGDPPLTNRAEITSPADAERSDPLAVLAPLFESYGTTDATRELWRNVLVKVRAHPKVSTASYITWIAPAQLLAVEEGDVAILGIPSQFASDQLRKKGYDDVIIQAMAEAGQPVVRLVVECPMFEEEPQNAQGKPKRRGSNTAGT